MEVATALAAAVVGAAAVAVLAAAAAAVVVIAVAVAHRVGKCSWMPLAVQVALCDRDSLPYSTKM